MHRFLRSARARAWPALLGLTVACAGAIRSIAPANLQPVSADSAAAWAAPFRPADPLEFTLRWVFENREGRAAGRAVARYAPPDTLRFDYRGPFGKSGSALVVGDTAVWSEPDGDIDNLVPVAPILWAALGIVTPADSSARLLGLAAGGRRAWRYVAGLRALDYIHVTGAEPQLLAELRDADEILGVVRVVLAGGGTAPVSAKMQFPGERSTFELTVREVKSVAAFPPETWQRP